MQREIKFRAFDKEAKTMHQVSVIDFEDKYVLYARNDFYKDKPFYMEKSFDEIELMQFTGLYDKNGKEIYEGDVIVFDLYSYWGHDIKEKGKIVFDGHAFVFKTKTGEYFLTDLDCCKEEDIEIIGNIYENPELLK